MLKVRPGFPGKATVTHTLNGLNGDNVLEFVDNGKIELSGAIIDNIGLYPWNRNSIC